MADEKETNYYAEAPGTTNGAHPSYTTQPDVEMSVGRYLATRIPSLKPPMTPLKNPITLLRMLSGKQWANFFVAFAGWTWDAFDFFTVSLTVGDLATTFNKSNKAITWGITLVLMLRSVGAIIFGILSDRYGRKWPFIGNLVLFIVLELGTGFTYDYQSFLGVRALYGIAMGGLYGNAAATALEDCPEEARGLISGMLQQGYAFGYLLATVFARALVGTTGHAWRPLYWFGAAIPVLIIIFRLFLGETDAFMERKRIRESGDSVGKTFVEEGKVALKKHWKLLIYMVLLMAGFNFMSHGSQDLYPTMLENQYGFGPDAVTVTQVVANLGAICGGTIIGYLSHALGRRFSIIYASIVGGALLYPYSFVFDGEGSSRGVLRAVLRPGSLGCDSHPPDGTFTRILPNLRRWYVLPARQPRLLRFQYDRSDDWRALPFAVDGRGWGDG